ncbi:MAG: YqiJ family protein [Planctomycetota bacterium]|jgi:hypothetical protein|nr:YqiJ family protein [Planctomycetota bacterium]
MANFLLVTENLAFCVALFLLFALFVMELLSLLFGAELSGALGDADLPGMDVDLDVDPGALANFDAFARFLLWLRIGKIPLMVALVLFLAAFALGGLLLQGFFLYFAGFLLPWYISVPAAGALTLPVVRTLGPLIGRIMPKDQTDAIAREELVGLIASIVLGVSAKGSPAQAKVKDRHGTTHYVMVEPDIDGQSFAAGKSVLLVRSDGVRFFAIADSGTDGL